MHCTVVGLSTTPAFLIIFHFFQIQNFMVLQQAFSYKKYMFSKRSGSKSFWSQKMAIFDICFFKGVFSKSSGKMIVAPIFCFSSYVYEILAPDRSFRAR